MLELEKIEQTKEFIDKLANGINPLDDSFIPDDDLLNNIKIARCMFYVSDVLQNVYDYLKDLNGTSKKGKKEPFSIAIEQLNKYDFEKESIPISRVVSKINELINQDEISKLKVSSVTEWLLKEKLLTFHTMPDGQEYKIPTEKGLEHGLTSEIRMRKDKNYPIVLYSMNAQKYIMDHIDEISNINNKTDASHIENGGKPWNSIQDEQLVEMFHNGLTIKEIADEMKRTYGAIRSRLLKFGLVESKNKL